MNPLPDFDTFARSVNRRAFLTQSAYGLGGIALASLLRPDAAAADAPAGIPENPALRSAKPSA